VLQRQHSVGANDAVGAAPDTVGRRSSPPGGERPQHHPAETRRIDTAAWMSSIKCTTIRYGSSRGRFQSAQLSSSPKPRNISARQARNDVSKMSGSVACCRESAAAGARTAAQGGPGQFGDPGLRVAEVQGQLRECDGGGEEHDREDGGPHRQRLEQQGRGRLRVGEEHRHQGDGAGDRERAPTTVTASVRRRSLPMPGRTGR
jgi:hypothetical protein